MEDLDLEISDDHLAEALLQLREVSGPERRWTTAEDADPIVGPGPTVVGKSKPRLPWVLLKTFTGPTSNEDAVRNLLPVAGLIWQDMSKRTDQRGMAQGEFRPLPTAHPPRPKKHSGDVVIDYKCPWAKVPIIIRCSNSASCS